MAKIKIVDTDTTPICPHCNKELTTIERVGKGFFGVTMVYLCSHCKKVISIGYLWG